MSFAVLNTTGNYTKEHDIHICQKQQAATKHAYHDCILFLLCNIYYKFYDDKTKKFQKYQEINSLMNSSDLGRFWF